MARSEPTTAEARAEQRAEYLSGLVWHAGAFVIINAFLWILDIVLSGGVGWAFWVTLTWGFALAFHALAYAVDGSRLRERAAARYLRKEREASR